MSLDQFGFTEEQLLAAVSRQPGDDDGYADHAAPNLDDWGTPLSSSSPLSEPVVSHTPPIRSSSDSPGPNGNGNATPHNCPPSPAQTPDRNLHQQHPGVVLPTFLLPPRKSSGTGGVMGSPPVRPATSPTIPNSYSQCPPSPSPPPPFPPLGPPTIPSTLPPLPMPVMPMPLPPPPTLISSPMFAVALSAERPAQSTAEIAMFPTYSDVEPPSTVEMSATVIPPPPSFVACEMYFPPPQNSTSPAFAAPVPPLSPLSTPRTPTHPPLPAELPPPPPPGDIPASLLYGSPPPLPFTAPPPPPLVLDNVLPPPPVTDSLPPPPPFTDPVPPPVAPSSPYVDIPPPPPADIPPPSDFIPPPATSSSTTVSNRPTREFRQSMPPRRGSIEEAEQGSLTSSGSWQRSFLTQRRGSHSASPVVLAENAKLKPELKILREQLDLTKKNLSGTPGLDQLLHFNELRISTEAFDTAAENCIMRMERNHIQYQMLAIKTFLSLTEEVTKLKTGKEVLQKMCKTLQGQLEAALNTTSDYSEEGIIYSIDKKNPNNPEKEIKGGTIEKLVARLFAKNVESQYLDIFLLTYRSYTDANTVLGMVIKAFDDNTSTEEEVRDQSVSAQQRTVKKKTTRLRICNVLRRWTDNYWHDFWDDSTLLETYKRFVEANKEVQGLLKPGLDKRLALGSAILQRSWVFSSEPPPPIVPSRANFEEIDPVEMARQMSMQEFELYVNIQAKEMLSLSWSKKDKEKRSPNLLAMIHRFNAVSNWTTATIVKEPDLRKRANIVRKFIRILEELYKLNNFNAVFEISAGLNSSAITRLKLTWAEVKETTKTLEKMASVTAPTSSFANFRGHLHRANPPCIPYLGVYLTDLTFIEEGNNDTVENTYVHFAKFRMVAAVIQEMQQYQQKPYNFTRIDAIQHFLNNLDSLTEKEAFDLSLAIEKRAPSGSS
ncbi:Ras guanine nucleotide exchange factor [Pelomyxa schiedti]|nr:Ras guanine nucleotide exchange factor [Pelomyxa schiedti]